MEEKKNISISGSGSIAGGDYGSVRISGSGRSGEDIRADNIHISGSGQFCGLQARELHVSGSATANGDLTASEKAHISGSLKVSGNMEAQSLHVSGGMHVKGCLRGVQGQISGGITVDAGVEFEELRISGSAHIQGLLNADTLEIALGGNSDISEIGGSDIEVRRSETRTAILSAFFGNRRYGTLKCGSIEGTEVKLENTVCDTVRGKNVVIGPDCEIKRVEYTETISISEEARVDEQTKI